MIVPSGYKISLIIRHYTDNGWSPSDPLRNKKSLKLKLKEKKVFNDLTIKSAIQKLIDLLIDY